MMMRFGLFGGLLMAAVLLFDPADASAADDTGWWRGWSARSTLNTTVIVAGYRPGRIVEHDTDGFAARTDMTERTRIDSEVAFSFGPVEVWGRPYTVVPAEALRVNLAGVEGKALLGPHYLRLGVYHHSTHNFNRGAEGRYAASQKYGSGVELDALMLQLRPFDGPACPYGACGRYRIEASAYWFIPGISRNGSPNVLTRGTDIAQGETGLTVWRNDTWLHALLPVGRGAFGLTLNGTADGVSSVEASFEASLRLSFLGDPGKRFFFGPVVTYGANLDRAGLFGTETGTAALRLTVTLGDDDDETLR